MGGRANTNGSSNKRTPQKQNPISLTLIPQTSYPATPHQFQLLTPSHNPAIKRQRNRNTPKNTDLYFEGGGWD